MQKIWLKSKKNRKKQSNFVRGYFYECRKVEISHEIRPFFLSRYNILEPIWAVIQCIERKLSVSLRVRACAAVAFSRDGLITAITFLIGVVFTVIDKVILLYIKITSIYAISFRGAKANMCGVWGSCKWLSSLPAYPIKPNPLKRSIHGEKTRPLALIMQILLFLRWAYFCRNNLRAVYKKHTNYNKMINYLHTKYKTTLEASSSQKSEILISNFFRQCLFTVF